MRIVAGDVGGTKTLLRCVEGDGAISAEGRYDSGAYPEFEDLLHEFQQRCPGAVDAACLAVAGPVLDDEATVTNVGWHLRTSSLRASNHIDRIRLVNDFYAVAVGVPLLGPGDLHSLQRGVRVASAPIGILGAGTGLGEAILVPHGGEHVVVPTEGGHQDFAPQDEEQSRLFLALHARYGHVSWERLVSGMGLQNIHQFAGGEDLAPAEIADLAAKGDARATHTVRIFVDLYGAEAGNMALRVLARGGVFLAGGIAAKNVNWFTDGRFMSAFLRKGRFRDLLTEIPVDIIVNEQVGLIGAAALAVR
jgi:glucokinase